MIYGDRNINVFEQKIAALGVVISGRPTPYGFENEAEALRYIGCFTQRFVAIIALQEPDTIGLSSMHTVDDMLKIYPLAEFRRALQ